MYAVWKNTYTSSNNNYISLLNAMRNADYLIGIVYKLGISEYIRPYTSFLVL